MSYSYVKYSINGLLSKAFIKVQEGFQQLK